MHSAVLVLLVSSGLLQVALSDPPTYGTKKPETLSTMAGVWVKSTELPPERSTLHLWSLPKDLTTDRHEGLSPELPESTNMPTVLIPEGITLPHGHTGVCVKECHLAYQIAKKNNELLEDFIKKSEFLMNVIVQELEEDKCKIEMTSVSSSNGEVKKGLILVNGEQHGECNSKLSGYDAKPGLLLAFIRPGDCHVVNKRHLLVDSSDIDNLGEVFKMLMENHVAHTTVVGTTCGISNATLEKIKTTLSVFGVQLDGFKENGKLVFMIQTMAPGEGVVIKEDPIDVNKELKAEGMFKGNDTWNYGYDLKKL